MMSKAVSDQGGVNEIFTLKQIGEKHERKNKGYMYVLWI